MIAPQISPAAYVEALAEAPYADDFKLQISLVLGNFPYAVSILIETLREIYLQIDALHQKYAPQLAEKWRQVQSKQSKELFRQFYELDLSANWDSMLVSLSLLNQYILLQTVKNGRIGLLLGFCYAEELSHTIDERKLDLRQILIALGNDIRLSILQTLLEKGELTVSTLSKLLKIPGTTVLRHTEALYSCGILFISRRQGLQLFYKVNLLLLSQAVKAAEGRLSKFLPEGNSEGNRSIE